MREMSVGTRELKNRLSHYLRRVKAGEVVIITERGKPIGQIIPMHIDLTTRLKTLADSGVVDWNGEAVPSCFPKAVNQGGQLLSELIIEERG